MWTTVSNNRSWRRAQQRKKQFHKAEMDLWDFVDRQTIIDGFHQRHGEDFFSQDWSVVFRELRLTFWAVMDAHVADVAVRRQLGSSWEAMFRFCVFIVDRCCQQPVADLRTPFRAWLREFRMSPRSGAALLSRDLKHVLLVMSAGGKRLTFPSGMVEDGESPLQCAVREVKEETGVEVGGVLQQRLSVSTEYKGGRRHCFFAVTAVESGRRLSSPAVDEIEEMKWVRLDQLCRRSGAHGWQRPDLNEWWTRPLLSFVAELQRGRKGEDAFSLADNWRL